MSPRQVPHQDSQVAVPGGRCFVRRWEMDDSVLEPIILLHDSLGSVELWRDFPAQLAATTSRTVIAYDRLGFGQSTPRQGLPAADFIRDEAQVVFPALVEALGHPAYLVFGHSVGGAMAVNVAAFAPERCRALVTESAQAFVEERTREGIRAAKRIFADPAERARLARWHGDRAEWVLKAWTEVWLSPEFASWSLDESLPQVVCPTLVLHGDQDEFGSAAFPQRIAARVNGPVDFALMAGCGHVPHRERPEEVLARVSAFLQHQHHHWAAARPIL